RFTGADAEDDAAGEQRAEGAEHLGDDRRVVAEGGGEDGGAHDDAAGGGAERAEPGQRGGGVAVGVLPRLEVVADEDGVEADFFREDGEVEQLPRAELFGGGLVAEFEHGGRSRVWGWDASLGLGRPATGGGFGAAACPLPDDDREQIRRQSRAIV